MRKIKGKRGGSINVLEKGETANPQGRPKGSQNTATRMKRLFEMVVKDMNPFTGKEETFTGSELLDMALFKKALKGDVNAYREIIDRAEGKVSTPMEVTTDTITEIILTRAPGIVTGKISTNEEDILK